jgi:ferrous iron transport protein B
VVFPGKEGIMMFFLFIAGLIASLLMALLFKKTLFKGHSHYFIMELPEYKTPSLRSLGITSWSKAKSFLFTSGKTILLFSILLWFLSTHPRGSEPKESYIGQVGSYMENFTQTQGWDWKMGVGILSSFMAREVMVSTMAVLYGVEEDNEDGLKGKMRSDLDKNGAPLWNSVTGLSLLLFFAFASQCASTLAVVRKETNSYFWPLFQFLYMTILAIFSSWLVAVLVRNLN